MKLSRQDFQRMLREEYMRGVPEFMLRQASDECVENVRQHVKKYIQSRAENPAHAREMLQTSNEILEELGDSIYDLIEEKLWSFLQRT